MNSSFQRRQLRDSRVTSTSNFQLRKSSNSVNRINLRSTSSNPAYHLPSNRKIQSSDYKSSNSVPRRPSNVDQRLSGNDSRQSNTSRNVSAAIPKISSTLHKVLTSVSKPSNNKNIFTPKRRVTFENKLSWDRKGPSAARAQSTGNRKSTSTNQKSYIRDRKTSAAASKLITSDWRPPVPGQNVHTNGKNTSTDRKPPTVGSGVEQKVNTLAKSIPSGGQKPLTSDFGSEQNVHTSGKKTIHFQKQRSFDLCTEEKARTALSDQRTPNIVGKSSTENKSPTNSEHIPLKDNKELINSNVPLIAKPQQSNNNTRIKQVLQISRTVVPSAPHELSWDARTANANQKFLSSDRNSPTLVHLKKSFSESANLTNNFKAPTTFQKLPIRDQESNTIPNKESTDSWANADETRTCFLKKNPFNTKVQLSGESKVSTVGQKQYFNEKKCSGINQASFDRRTSHVALKSQPCDRKTSAVDWKWGKVERKLNCTNQRPYSERKTWVHRKPLVSERQRKCGKFLTTPRATRHRCLAIQYAALGGNPSIAIENLTLAPKENSKAKGRGKRASGKQCAIIKARCQSKRSSGPCTWLSKVPKGRVSLTAKKVKKSKPPRKKGRSKKLKSSKEIEKMSPHPVLPPEALAIAAMAAHKAEAAAAVASQAAEAATAGAAAAIAACNATGIDPYAPPARNTRSLKPPCPHRDMVVRMTPGPGGGHYIYQ